MVVFLLRWLCYYQTQVYLGSNLPDDTNKQTGLLWNKLMWLMNTIKWRNQCNATIIAGLVAKFIMQVAPPGGQICKHCQRRNKPRNWLCYLFLKLSQQQKGKQYVKRTQDAEPISWVRCASGNVTYVCVCAIFTIVHLCPKGLLHDTQWCSALEASSLEAPLSGLLHSKLSPQPHYQVTK